ncbi:MAG: hypothetical protein ACRYGO_19265 [Janthinobacterium lividum]
MHVKPHFLRSVPLLAFALGGLVSAVGAVEHVEPVRHQLEVETGEGRVRVRLTVENRGETPIWVPREVTAGDELTGRRFDLRDARGKPLDYTGMMVKRGALTAADWQEVKPHTMHMNTIDITPAYAFRKGRQGYEIRYDGPYLDDVNRLDALSHSPAQPVRFGFGR